MPKRPLTVTVIGFIILIQAAMNFLSLTAIRKDPALLAQAIPTATGADISRAIPIAMFACVLMFLIGLSLLRGLSWARIAVVALALLVTLMALMSGNTAMLLGAGLHAMMAFLLYRPAANAFFEAKRRGGSNPPPPPSDGPNGGTGSGEGSGNGRIVV